MNKFITSAAAGLILLAGSALPGYCDTNSFELSHDQCIKGTFKGMHMGQVQMRTDDGKDIELPSMAIFFGTDPQVHQADLRAGDHLVVTLPCNTTMHVMDGAMGMVSVGDYEGVAFVPQDVLGMWQSDSWSVADR